MFAQFSQGMTAATAKSAVRALVLAGAAIAGFAGSALLAPGDAEARGFHGGRGHYGHSFGFKKGFHGGFHRGFGHRGFHGGLYSGYHGGFGHDGFGHRGVHGGGYYSYGFDHAKHGKALAYGTIGAGVPVVILSERTARAGQAESAVGEGAFCREYRGDAVIDGQETTIVGTVCRQPDGSWKIVG